MVKFKNYTEEQIQYIKDNYVNLETKEIATKLNITPTKVSYIANKLGLKKQSHAKWTEEQLDFLRNNYINMTSEEISKKVKHTVHAVNTKRVELGLIRHNSWTEEEIAYLKENYDKATRKELSNKMNRTATAIEAKCKDLGLIKKEPDWTKKEITFLKENYMELPTKEIAEILGRTPNGVQIKARKLGMKKYPYNCDYRFFETIDTEEKAYWLGFLVADGWVNKNDKTGAGVTGIELQYGDINHLKKFNKSIKGNYKITDRWRPCELHNNPKENHSCTIRVYSRVMYNDLEKYGFGSDKTYDCAFPVLNEELFRHFIRGYFDGDGRFCFTDKSFRIAFITASEQLGKSIKGVLNDRNYSHFLSSYVNEFGTVIYDLSINQKNQAIDFLNYIYKDCTVYLDRKYKKYQKVLKKFC